MVFCRVDVVFEELMWFLVESMWFCVELMWFLDINICRLRGIEDLDNKQDGFGDFLNANITQQRLLSSISYYPRHRPVYRQLHIDLKDGAPDQSLLVHARPQW